MKQYHRKSEEAKRLGVGLRTLEKWMAENRVPFIRIGNVVLFDPVAVDTALANFSSSSTCPNGNRGAAYVTGQDY